MRHPKLIIPAVALASIFLVTVPASRALGHAFPVRSEPRVGVTIDTSPLSVIIWFDGKLEPAFSTITVYNSAQQRVDKGNGQVSPSDTTLLKVDLPQLPPGTYRVYWNVLSVDTHRTEGDFAFTVKGRAP